MKIRVLSLTFGEFIYSYPRSSFLFSILIGGVGLMSNQIWKKSFFHWGWEKSKRPSNNLQLNKSRKLQWVFFFLVNLFLWLHNKISQNLKWRAKMLGHCWGYFYDKGQKCKNDPNLPLGSLEIFICGESTPKFQMYIIKKG